MDIIIRLDANHERGMGHLYRMITLSELFREKGFEILFLIRENKVAEEILKQKNEAFKKFPEEQNEVEIISEFFYGCHQLPSLWIFDILNTEKNWVTLITERQVPSVCFDDLKGGLFAADLVINAIAGCWDANEADCSSKVLKGPSFAITKPYIRNVRNNWRRLPSEKIKVAITMGGSDTYGATIKVGNVLSKLDNLEIDLMFFLGPNFQHETELDELVQRIPFNYSVKKAVKDIHRELMETDVLFCGGGQTMLEACAMGLPVLSLANEPHEEKTIVYFSQRNACVNIGSVHKMIYTERILSFFEKFKAMPDDISSIINNAKELVDGRGACRCRDECLLLIP